MAMQACTDDNEVMYGIGASGLSVELGCGRYDHRALRSLHVRVF